MYLLYLTTTMCQPMQHLLCQMAVGLNHQMDFQLHWCLHQQLQLHPEAFDALSRERSTKTAEMMQNFAHSQRISQRIEQEERIGTLSEKDRGMKRPLQPARYN